MTKISILAAVLSVSATLVGGLTFTSRPAPRTTTTTLFSVADDVTKQTGYAAGKANTEFARRFGHRAGMKVPTVSDSMTKFTADLDQPINALYRNYVTDLVATTHLTVVDARWSYDAVWALGMETVLDLLLKNYPEKDIAAAICESLSSTVANKSMETIRSDAATIVAWAEGKTKAEVESAVSGEGDGPLAAIAKAAKADEFWLYSRFFGVGLVRVMEITKMDLNTDTISALVEGKMGKSPQKAISDLDQWNGLKSKLSMMETLMKEIEIREKKKMADRLEEKAAAVIAKQKRTGDAEKAFDAAVASDKAEATGTEEEAKADPEPAAPSAGGE